MFTGIIDHHGQIKAIDKSENKIRLTISSKFTDLTLGESIAIDGVCLTIVDIDYPCFSVELSPETLKLTIACSYVEGIAVNLERSLRLNDRLGGHFVTGHVDGMCRVKAIIQESEFLAMTFEYLQETFTSFLVRKGSIAINGVSLTLNEILTGYFTVMLIPHTLKMTNLGKLKENSIVNIEYDYLAKLVNQSILSGMRE